MTEAASDYRTLIKSKHYIDLPGESPKSKLWPGVNNLIILRKHRDVVFDIKLGTGATYTITTDRRSRSTAAYTTRSVTSM